MKRVSFQGKTLSAAQRRQLDLQARMRAISTSPFQTEVQQALAVLHDRKEQGIKPDKQHFLVSSERGTISVAEWMGF
ncbi:hypothetical protein [Pseudomonas huanghezhanensis]|uniref:hypothetical protein n=1 Tax=Pseudomonas huanghezhanensis TaxID=3002903 RepID=UPI0022864BFC|nr:hypothetical protein [Pseudomonas sp. BSw22131]